MEQFKIWFDSEDVARKVLAGLQKEGARWYHVPGMPPLYDAIIRPSFGMIVKHTDKGIVLTDVVTKKDFYKRKDYAPIREISPVDYLGVDKPCEKCESIALYRNGMVVTAVDKNTGNVGIAKCCPDDEFDFSTGAMIALERLADKNEEGTGINTRFVVIDSNENTKFTIGGIYEVVDGFFVDDYGVRSPETCRLKSKEDMREYLTSGNKPAKRRNCLLRPISYIEIVER